MNTICIAGAGAIGGFLGAKLGALPGVRLSALARGATLAALQTHGCRLQTAAGLVQAPVRASSSAAELGPQDLVIVAVKSQALPELAPQLAPLMGPNTVVMHAMNGVPWWFGHSFTAGVAGLDASPLKSVDPTGSIAVAIPLAQVLACVVHASTATSEPGLVQHRVGNGLIVGEPGSGGSARVDAVTALLKSAGFDATASANIRYDIWYKLWGNMTMNPVSAITGATGDRVLADPLVRAFCSACMSEAAAVGEKLGLPIAQTPEERHGMTAKLGAFKTSMLQDVEAGRSMELDALVGAVRELGERVGVATPNIDALMGLARLFAQGRGLYPA